MIKSNKRKVSNVAIVTEEDATVVTEEDATIVNSGGRRSSNSRKRTKSVVVVTEKVVQKTLNGKIIAQIEKSTDLNNNIPNHLEISSSSVKSEKNVVSQTNTTISSHVKSIDSNISSCANLNSTSNASHCTSVTELTVQQSDITNNIVQQEERRVIVQRSLGPATKNSDPALCLNQIDRMYLLYYEKECMYSPGLMIQNDINYKMRAILIDWLIEVHNKFKLHAPTLWLCVNIIDRYLEKEKITRSNLQLLGVTALLLASKYEEIYPPELKECVFITDNAYNAKDVLAMELKVLLVLNFDLCVPTGYHFLTKYLDCIKPSKSTRYLAQYYCERNLQEITAVEYKPHIFAAAAIYAALKQQTSTIKKLTGATVWSPLLQEETGLLEADLKKCAAMIIRCASQSTLTASKRELVAAKKKFASDKYLNVSTLQLPYISQN